MFPNPKTIHLDSGVSLLIDPVGRLISIHSENDLLREPALVDRIRNALEEDAQNHQCRWLDVQARLMTLTDRERQVMDLLLDARQTKQIARDLKISEKTVDYHRKNILQKMGVTSVVELMRQLFTVRTD